MPSGSEVVVTDGAGVTVTATEDDLVESVTEVAVTVTAKFEETGVGATYVTDVLVAADNAPHAAPVHRVPETLHVTA